MSFVIRPRQEDQPETPEALFRSLRPRDRSVRDLLLRQGDVLREYSRVRVQESDVAVELPTGGGKTLVGLLIAEWRRKTLGQRVAYLCPTVQLANQAAAKAHDYGLDVVTLVRAQADWDPAEFTRFQRAQAVAIAGYKQIFNSNPRLDSAQTLVLDDAHAAEDAVASNWSVNARRGTLLYEALVAAFADYLPSSVRRRLERAEVPARDRYEVVLVPAEAMPVVATAVEEALNEYARSPADPNTYTRTMIGGQVDRCLAYVSWAEVLIRPLIPPTSDHAAFAGASQRVYMSATLGSSGEMQRAFGVTQIKAVSAQSDERGFGRRFFLMPQAARQRPDEITAAAVEAAGRAVILAPSNAEVDDAAASVVPSGVPLVRPTDVERGFESFVDRDQAVLLLANRYDGIDLPDDACRLLVLSGLPAHSHAQERFFMDVLGARRVLSERIRTRIQQGAGRATRNARDFAAVIVRGERLNDLLSRDEEIRSLPPHLQAEIDFGFDNSEDPDADLVAMLRAFWEQGEEWQPAEQALVSKTAELRRAVPAEDNALAASAEKEVEAWRALWRDDLPRAVALAQEVTDRLIGGDELRPYRALWFYLAASWAARLAGLHPEQWSARAEELRREAEGAARTLRWNPHWLDTPRDEVEATSEPDVRAARAAQVLRGLGVRGGRFEQHLQETQLKLAQDAAGEFEEGLRRLGVLLGFEAVRPSGQADPDSAWRDETRQWILFEAKTEERADTPLAAEAVRQATTHAAWVQNELEWEPPTETLTVIVSHKASIDPAAVPIAGDLRIAAPEVVRSLAERTFAGLRQARAAARGLSDSQLAERISAEFAANGLGTEHLVGELGVRRIADG